VSELDFQIISARPERYAAAPMLSFGLRVSAATDEVIHSVTLRCQIRIEPQRRRYSRDEEERLVELFGETPRWGDTLKPFLWTHVSTALPGFTGSAEMEMHVPCTYDLEVAAAKYFHVLDDGEVPLLFLFSGTVFAKSATGIRVSQIPWSKESSYRLPVQVWRELMDLYFPNSGWLRLRRDTLNLLLKFKARRTIATWDDVLEALLKEAGECV
jgi:hypothetical protein